LRGSLACVLRAVARAGAGSLPPATFGEEATWAQRKEPPLGVPLIEEEKEGATVAPWSSFEGFKRDLVLQQDVLVKGTPFEHILRIYQEVIERYRNIVVPRISTRSVINLLDTIETTRKEQNKGPVQARNRDPEP
jgi:hypothetical protein